MSDEDQTYQNGNDEDEYYDYQEIRVDPGQTPKRIDKFLMDRLYGVSRNRLQNAIKAGNVLVDEKQIKPNFKVKPNHQIKVLVPKPPGQEAKLVPQKMDLDIRYEDEDLLIVHKPAGMVVHPGIGHRKGTLVNGLAYHFGMDNLPDVGENYQERVGLVHRIDKNTSGLLVVAKNEYTITHLARQFYEHTIERTYNALVWGDFDEGEDKGTVNAHVGRHPRFRKKFTAFPEGEQGKWAVTHYQVLERLYYVSLIQCKLETGRTHQIRVHMQHLGHPLFNDEKYGGHLIVKGTVYSKYKLFVERMFATCPRHALHAKSLGFVHPRTKKWMQFDSELPGDIQEALAGWRRYVEGRKSAMGKLDG